MKLKMGGKIFLVVLLGLGAFFLIKHYQSTHPAPNVAVTTDSATIKSAPDSQEAVTGKPDTNTTPSAQNGEATAPAKITPQSAHPEHLEHIAPVHHAVPKPKKKDGERENVKLDNY